MSHTLTAALGLAAGWWLARLYYGQRTRRLPPLGGTPGHRDQIRSALRDRYR